MQIKFINIKHVYKAIKRRMGKEIWMTVMTTENPMILNTKTKNGPHRQRSQYTQKSCNITWCYKIFGSMFVLT